MAPFEEFGEKPGAHKGHAYGAASVTNALSGANFPTTKQQLIKEYGQREIHWTKDHAEKLKEVLEKLPHDRFETMPDVVEAIGEMGKTKRQ